jgi:hypothetical protein
MSLKTSNLNTLYLLVFTKTFVNLFIHMFVQSLIHSRILNHVPNSHRVIISLPESLHFGLQLITVSWYYVILLNKISRIKVTIAFSLERQYGSAGRRMAIHKSNFLRKNTSLKVKCKFVPVVN